MLMPDLVLLCGRFEPAVPYELKLVFPAGQPRGNRAVAFAALLREHLAASAT
jgi:hypothetical protein